MAVCELRFPTLLELENQKPVGFQRALRKQYPLYEPKLDVSLELGGTATTAHNHVMRSKDRRWAVSLRPAAIGLETTHYTNFEELEKRLRDIMQVAPALIDSDFYTRVGLRYVNALPISQQGLDGWVNPSLVAPLVDGVLKSAEASRSWKEEMSSATDTGTPAITPPYGAAVRDESAFVAPPSNTTDDSVSELSLGEAISLGNAASTWTSLVSASVGAASVVPVRGGLQPSVSTALTVHPDPAVRANSQRLALLARRYAKGSLDTEEEARLEIVQTRVATLIPRVTEADYIALEERIVAGEAVVDRIAKRAAARKARRSRRK